MFKKVLIANRGEIALRVIRACKELGLQTVAVYSEADRECLHVRFAEDDVCIGRAPSRDSYLNIPRIIAAAEITGADAIHPGYGFLAENAEFAEIVQASNITFIGPTPDQIRQMGDKATARNIVQKLRSPRCRAPPGRGEPRGGARDRGADRIPGDHQGGGRRRRERHARRGRPRAVPPGLYLGPPGGAGRFRLRPRLHREIPGTPAARRDSGHGRHPRQGDAPVRAGLLGATPPPETDRGGAEPRGDQTLREDMGEAAVKAAESIGYVGAGTVEFLLDEDGAFYFMEMNTRIQVEHPVTEMCTNFDLVKEQIRVAAGEPLSLIMNGNRLRGHAIECRVNAEDPARNFQPSPGLITAYHPPGGPGVRVDTHIYAGYTVPPYYDSLLAKVIVHGNSREEALARMRQALDSFIIEGVTTTIPFLGRVMRHPDFVAGKVDTKFLEREPHLLKDQP